MQKIYKVKFLGGTMLVVFLRAIILFIVGENKYEENFIHNITCICII